MMKIENVVDDIVLLILNDTSSLKDLGLDQPSIYTRVKGYDEYGLWIEHPGLQIPQLPKEADLKVGKLPKKPRFQTVPATVLIPWPNVSSIVHFPDVEGFDFPSPFEHQTIGFKVDSGN
ncbi:MAG: hypothetical protein HQ528_04055 [Candidatus Marinimicrobia bacterium]|nr:hypothetical protein [Candidatus Neomarinimicrobiota bacterium]